MSRRSVDGRGAEGGVGCAFGLASIGPCHWACWADGQHAEVVRQILGCTLFGVGDACGTWRAVSPRRLGSRSVGELRDLFAVGGVLPPSVILSGPLSAAACGACSIHGDAQQVGSIRAMPAGTKAEGGPCRRQGGRTVCCNVPGQPRQGWLPAAWRDKAVGAELWAVVATCSRCPRALWCSSDDEATLGLVWVSRALEAPQKGKRGRPGGGPSFRYGVVRR